MTVATEEDALDAAYHTLAKAIDDDESLSHKEKQRFIAEAAQGIRAAHDRARRLHEIAETIHVHDVPHVPVITTEPLAHLKEPAKKGDTVLVLQPRHAGHPFTTLTVGTEKVEAAAPSEAVMAPIPEGVHPAIAATLHIDQVVSHTTVTLTEPLQHDHAAGVTVSADGFDPERVNTDAMRCHDCGRELVADVAHERVLVCQSVYGHRPSTLLPKHPDGAVECGQKD